jgi:hypothetical protein
MFRLQDSMTLIPAVSSRIFTLIESEDDTGRLGIFWFLSQTYYNAIPTSLVGDTYL